MQNNKILKIFISILLVFIMSVNMYACDNTNKIDIENTPADTGKNIILNGKSDYKIVIPKEPLDYEKYAAGELQYFLNQSTGINLEIISDENLIFNNASQYLSVGETELFNTSGITLDRTALKKSGFKIVTKGNSIIMVGGGKEGTLCSVYKYLENTINYKFYASDEIKMTKSDTVKLLDFDISEIPSIDRRMIGSGAFLGDEDYNRRLKLVYFDEGFAVKGGHTHFQIMPKIVYYASHPDWYSEDGTQLCLTNKDMIAEFINNVKKFLIDNPETTYIMLGHEDNNTFCECVNCKAESDLYSNSGVLMRFMNKISIEVTPWLEENYSGRSMTFVTFAYLKTEDPPVIKDQITGEWKAIDPSVIPADNVAILYAPLLATWRYSLSDPKQTSVNNKLLRWNTITSNLYIYSYWLNVNEFFMHFNNFSVIQDNYKYAVETGSSFFYEQGANQSGTTALMELRLFLMSNLMYNVNLNAEDLVTEFMDNYYGPAGKIFKEYYDSVRLHYLELEEDKNLSGSIFNNICTAANFPTYLIDKWDDMFDKAISEIEPLKIINDVQYQKYWNRIKKESLTVDYLNLRLYSSMYPDTFNQMIDDFEYFTTLYKLNYFGEYKPTQDFIISLRN